MGVFYVGDLEEAGRPGREVRKAELLLHLYALLPRAILAQMHF